METGSNPGGSRRDELRHNLRVVHARISAAADVGGRDPDSITLIVVTKTWPASDVALLAELGVTDVGENRDQEASEKFLEASDLLHQQPGPGLTWHFIGQLQTNKAKSVASYADVVQSIDRLRLVSALSRGAEDCGRTIRCLVQVQLDGPNGKDQPPGGRGGAGLAGALELADAISAANRLELAGVMGVAPLGEDPAPAFGHLRAVAEEVRRGHPAAKIISAGMSGDLEAAVTQGATHVRVGSAVLGGRPPVG